MNKSGINKKKRKEKKRKAFLLYENIRSVQTYL